MILEKSTEELGGNTYNPYVEEKDEKAAQNLKVESLDDLFEDEPKAKEETKNSKISELKFEQPKINDSLQKSKPMLDLENFKEDAPMLPQEDENDIYDLQKELEAKFDELFGPIDD